MELDTLTKAAILSLKDREEEQCHDTSPQPWSLSLLAFVALSLGSHVTLDSIPWQSLFLLVIPSFHSAVTWLQWEVKVSSFYPVPFLQQ